MTIDSNDKATRARHGPGAGPSAKQRDVFLSVLRTGQTVTAACQQALGVPGSRDRFYHLRGRDEAFADAWDAAYEDGTQAIEQEAWRRAVDGTSKPVFQGGAHVGDVQEYSDVLLLNLLRARRPGTYRERFKHEHTHRGSVDLRLDRLSDDELADLERLVAKAEADEE